MNDFLYLNPVFGTALSPRETVTLYGQNPTCRQTRARRKDHQPFSVRVRVALVRENLTISDLARELGVSRTTANHAIHHGMFRPTRLKIAQRLRIAA